MLARTPRTPPEKLRVKPWKLNRDRRRHMVEHITELMRKAHAAGAPSRFTFEASCRHGLRRGLCLQGWPWRQADEAAADIVATALRRLGASRPTWYEGQPEWTQDGVKAVEYLHCKRCRGPIPEDRRVFCSYECKMWHHAERGRQAREEDIKAGQAAWYVATGKAKRRARDAEWSEQQPERTCEHCKLAYKPNRSEQRFCGQACSRQARGW